MLLAAPESDGACCAPHAPIKGHYFQQTGDPAKPWVDIFEGKKAFKGNNVTFMHEHLAFGSPQFERERPQEWMDVVLSLTEGSIKRASNKDAATYQRVKAARAAAAGVNSATAAALPAFSAASALVSGKAAALKKLAAAGQQPVEPQRLTDLQISVANDCLMRWIVLANLPLHCVNHPAFREWVSLTNVVYAPRALNYDAIRHGDYLNRMFEQMRVAVEDVLRQQRAVFTITDGWTSDKETLINACDYAAGLPFWAYQKTPPAVSHTAECYYDVCETSLSRPNNYGACCDNPDTMLAFRGLVVKNSNGKKYAAACCFHDADLLPGDLLGLTGVHTTAYNVPALLSASDKSVTAFAREVQKFFSNRSLPQDLLRQHIRDFNVLQKAAGREERAVSLKQMGKTRKASVANLYNSVAASTAALRSTVNSHAFNLYKAKLSNTSNKPAGGSQVRNTCGSRHCRIARALQTCGRARARTLRQQPPGCQIEVQASFPTRPDVATSSSAPQTLQGNCLIPNNKPATTFDGPPRAATALPSFR